MPEQQKRQDGGFWKYAIGGGAGAAVAKYWGHIKDAGRFIGRNFGAGGRAVWRSATAVERFLASQGVRIAGGARVALVTIGEGITAASVSTAALVALPLFGGIYYFSVYKYRKELEGKMTKQEQDVYTTRLLDRTIYYMAQGMSPEEASALAVQYLTLIYSGRGTDARNLEKRHGIVSKPIFDRINARLRDGGIDPETDPRAKTIWQEIRKGIMQGYSMEGVMEYVDTAIESTKR